MSATSITNKKSEERLVLLEDLKATYGKNMNNIGGLLGVLRYFFEMEKGDYIDGENGFFGSSVEYDIVNARLVKKLDQKRAKGEDVRLYDEEYTRLIDDMDELNKVFSNNRKSIEELKGPSNKKLKGFENSKRPVLKCPVECDDHYSKGHCGYFLT